MYSGGDICRSGAVPTVDSVTFSNYSGDAIVAGLVIGRGMPHALNIPQSVTNFKWESSIVTAPSGVYVDDTLGTIMLDNVKLRGLTNGAMLNAIWTNSTISYLKINNVSLIRTPTGHSPHAGVFDGTEYWGSAVINDLDINGFKIEDEGGYYATPIKALIEMGGATPSSVVNLKYANVDFSKIAALSNGGSITTITRIP